MQRHFKAVTLMMALASPLIAAPAFAADPTILTLGATGHASGTPTLLTATLTIQADAGTAAEAQSRVNALASGVRRDNHDDSGVRVSFRDYDVSQVQENNSRTHWSARQTLVLTGTDGERVLKFVSTLQSRGLALSSVVWSLDDETRQKLEKQARTDALKKLRQDAVDAAEALGLHVESFKAVHLDQRVEPRPVMMMARMASAPAPQRSSDDAEDVTVSVRGEVRLAP